VVAVDMNDPKKVITPFLNYSGSQPPSSSHPFCSAARTFPIKRNRSQAQTLVVVDTLGSVKETSRKEVKPWCGAERKCGFGRH
jgi:hypothetical protein